MSKKDKFNIPAKQPSPPQFPYDKMVEAARRGDIEALKDFDKRGFNLNYQRGAALKAAVENSHTDVIDFLLARNALPISLRYEPLVLAMRTGRVDIFEKLWREDAPVTDKMNLYLRLICEAYEQKNDIFIEYLFTKKEVPDQLNKVQLMSEAAVLGLTPLVERLLKNGFDVNLGDGVALKKAINSERFDLVDFLLENGADPNIDNGRIFVISLFQDKRRAVGSLFKYGASLMAQQGLAFVRAAQKGYINLVKEGIAQGIDVNIRGGDALSFAAQSGHTDMVELLISKGADPRLSEHLAFFEAIRQRNTDVLKSLLIAPFDIHAQDGRAGIRALENNDVTTFAILCEAGYDPRRYERELGAAVQETLSREAHEALGYYLKKYRYREKMLDSVVEMVKRKAQNITIKDLKTTDKYGNTVLDVLVSEGRLSLITDPRLWRGQEDDVIKLIHDHVRHIEFKDKAIRLDGFEMQLKLQKRAQTTGNRPKIPRRK